MAAPAKVKSGIPGLDEALENIRLGDNVVWRLSSLDQFSLVADPFVAQAVADGRNMVYLRFAQHEPLVPEQPGVKRYELDPTVGFESFTIAVRNIITEEGRGAFYVFDSLSDLQVAWNADLTMGNFFRVTCPYLYEMETVAYFPLLRSMHSFTVIAKIRDTTQLLLDLFSGNGQHYIHPLKVYKRHSQTMFLPHAFDPKAGTVEPLLDRVAASGYYAIVDAERAEASDQNMDSWDRYFVLAKMDYQRGILDEDKARRQMCKMMMTRDTKMREMVLEYFDPTDLFAIRDRMVGTGLIGGKACGMLLARKIVEKRLPEYASYMEPHDSYYVGSDVFYSYLVENGCWPLRIRQRAPEGFTKEAPALRRAIEQGTFPEDIRNAFTRILDYYGQTPIIVRSSSFLEDGFGNAFAGKYESVFCPNIGPFDKRLEEFEDAVRRVYASTMDPSALEYRLRNGLDKSEEQMALLVQRVSGSQYGDYYFPTAAGVGYSHSVYCWSDDMDPDAGILRLVMGLGTKAVDRTSSDYARIVSLDKPLATTAKTAAEKHRYSQNSLNLIDLGAGRFSEAPCTDLMNALPNYARDALFEHDRDAEARLRERGQYRPVMFASCQGLVENREYIGLMRAILGTLADAYSYPVDIEFTVNIGEEGRFVVSLLQCRPLQAFNTTARIELPQADPARTLLHSKGASMGNSRESRVDAVIAVDPERYYHCAYAKKSLVAYLIGQVNATFKDSGKTVLLMVPGRVGTSSPELGVPVTFGDISNLSAVWEVAYSGAGYSPELSYGSHMFQDFVEADILYGAVFEDERTICYHPELLREQPEVLEDLVGAEAVDSSIAGIVKVYDTSESGLTLYYDTMEDELLCAF